jgi:FkbM family methyltransferase
MKHSSLIFANLRDAFELNLLFPLRHLAPYFGRTELRMALKAGGQFTFRTRSSDANTLRSVFRDKCYDVDPFPQSRAIHAAYKAILDAGKIPVIVDAGANIGAASLWFSSQFPRARIIAVEPESRNAALCRRNLAKTPTVTVMEAALGASSGRISITNHSGEAWGFMTSRNAEGEIPVVTIPELTANISGGQLFAAKIDIEGFEADLFSTNTDWLDELKFMFLEPHDWMLPDQGSSRAFQSRMAKGDFELIVAGENLLYVALGSAGTVVAQTSK